MKKKTIMAVCFPCALCVLMMACQLSVSDPIRTGPIFEPYISIQPESHSYMAADYSSAPELKVEVWDWEKPDGALSYQWYTFETLEEFYKDQARAIDGAVESTYTPSGITATAGARYYYYVEVTNTNRFADNGTDGAVTAATLRSDVAIISFSGPGQLAVPVIIQNPLDATYIKGRTTVFAPLDVLAEVSGGTMQYQWYRFDLGDGFDAEGYPKGTAIPNAATRSYLPGNEDLYVGKNYYYVVVSNVRLNPDGSEIGRTDLFSAPAVITMAMGEKAAPPRLDIQPRDILYFTGDNKTTVGSVLSVGAVTTDGGELSYQWYSSATKDGDSWTLIEDAEDAEYLPGIATAAEGTMYYYVKVTNTNENVTGNKIESLVSQTAAVRVRAVGSLTPNAFIEVKPNEKFQYIRGYGGMYIVWGNFFEHTDEDMRNMYDPDVLGFNIMRIMIPPSDTDIEVSMLDAVTRLKKRYYDNCKIVNDYGGYLLASPWSPPAAWKSNNSINSGGHLMSQYYKQYANYLRSFARHMSNKGAPIYAVSIANEPNYAGGYDGCEWTPNEMRDFYKEVGRFTQGVRGYGGGKQTPAVLTVNGESANNPDINHAAMDDAASSAAIDFFARHVYGEQTVRLWNRQNLNGREVWMTEHNINSASDAGYPLDWTWNYLWRFMNDVDLVIRMNNENAFVWWASKRFYSFIGDGAAGTTGGDDSTGNILPRGWGLAHYSKFTIDTTRVAVDVTGTLVDATPIKMDPDTGGHKSTDSGANVNNNKFDLDNPSVKITAYMSRDGNELSLVMWTPTLTGGSGGFNLGNVEIKMPEGFTIRSAQAMRSRAVSATSGAVTNMGKWEDVVISSTRDKAYVNLPRSEILSVKFIKE